MKCPHCQGDNPDDTRFCGHCGRELFWVESAEKSVTKTFVSPHHIERGNVIAGRYEVVEEIGKGGMGTVYKVYDTKIKEYIALKLLKPEIASDSETIERFRNEIKLARKIGQRHVCRMYDIGEEGYSYYITMEYIPGENLKRFIRRSGHLNEAKAIFIAKQVCEGLAEAHRLGIVHRDLKPQNIMIDHDGNTRIMDFGIAQSVVTRGITGTGSIIGTPEYMSPEQAEAKSIDPRSDIYSLGAILFEMVTGHVPFEGETPLSVAIKHKSEPPQNPREINSQISEGMSQIILLCLKKRQEERYQNAEDLLADLDRIEKGLRLAEKVTSKAQKTDRLALPEKEITIKFKLRKAIVPFLVFLVVVLAAFQIFRPSAKKPPDEAEPQLPKRSPIVTRIARPEDFRNVVQRTIGMDAKDTETAKKIITFLTPLLGEAAKSIDPKDLEQVERYLVDLKAKLPEKGPFLEMWSEADAKIKEGKKQQQAGKIAESHKSVSKSQSEMRQLLTLVQEKQNADTAKAEMEEAKKKAEEAQLKNGENLLHWIALEKEKDASDAYAKNDFSGAKTLYMILRKVYGLSIMGGDEESCLRALQGLVRDVKTEVDSMRGTMKDMWLYERAGEEAGRANVIYRDGQYAESAEFYILAAFLYAKSMEVASASSQPLK